MGNSPKTVAILLHARQKFSAKNYFLRLLVDEWQKQNINVLFLKGTKVFKAADAVVLHVNLTVVPEEYCRFANRYPVVVNGRAIDISKRRVSMNLLDGTEDYHGPVIIKTNQNSGGNPEQCLNGLPGPAGWLQRKIVGAMPWSWTGRLASSAYPIYDTMAAVPDAIWQNPRLVVEKFLSERKDRFYCLRQWVFFGDREINVRSFSEQPIVKAANIVGREQGLPVPAQLRKMREELGFDYGKFDYSIVDDRVVLYDANRTPTANHNNLNSRVRAIALDLSNGIAGFLG